MASGYVMAYPIGLLCTAPEPKNTDHLSLALPGNCLADSGWVRPGSETFDNGRFWRSAWLYQNPFSSVGEISLGMTSGPLLVGQLRHAGKLDLMLNTETAAALKDVGLIRLFSSTGTGEQFL